jgi:hypothetical protein
MDTLSPKFNMSMRGILLIGGMYSVAWAAFFKYLGNDLMIWLSMTPNLSHHVQVNWFGLLGIIIGISIFLSAFYPISWRSLILVGIVGKLVSSLWFVLEIIPVVGWNKRSVFYFFFNEILWIFLLSLVLHRSYKVYQYLKNLPD